MCDLFLPWRDFIETVEVIKNLEGPNVTSVGNRLTSNEREPPQSKINFGLLA